MKRFIMSKKGFALLAVLVVAAAGAIAGYAYFTSTGTGSGSATVGAASNWSVGQVSSVGGPLYPDPASGGTNKVTVAYTVKNNNQGNQKLNQVLVDVGGVSNAAFSTQANTGAPACTANDFALDGTATGNTVTDTWATDLTAGQVVTGHVTVDMIDNGATQDNCQNQTVPLYFSAS
jgi:hypothetical protein